MLPVKTRKTEVHRFLQIQRDESLYFS